MLKIVDKKEDVPEALRDSAHEMKDGKFGFDEADSAADDLKTALDGERTKREAAEKNAKKAADELKKLQNQRKATDSGITEEQLNQIRADVRKEVETEVQEKFGDYDKVKADNRSLRLDTHVKKQMADAGFLGTRLDDAWKLYGDQFDLTSDGKPMVKDKPGLDVKKHIEGLTKLQPSWVQGTKAAGGGAAGQNTGPTDAKPNADAVLSNPGAALAQARAAGATE